jgi:hypothetical protein
MIPMKISMRADIPIRMEIRLAAKAIHRAAVSQTLSNNITHLTKPRESVEGLVGVIGQSGGSGARLFSEGQPRSSGELHHPLPG